jgi:hypothetical protein
VAASPEILPRAMQIFYRLGDEPVFDGRHSIWIPLLADGALHEYSYDLRLLELGRGARLSGLRIDPVVAAAATGTNQITVTELRLTCTPGATCGASQP